ncbi:hypothetical protein SAMN05421678_1266 [Actinopolymorpha cephalotaxi]|uniref:Uncharacterized protein n=1 Tax=Actinopolymorpha cephalotaxi TaxID=504797 RepID=A0A1I3BQ92_9ACTN|nr:hypothetical protein [Actinopolymorpha cephalotaxi]NYH83783.1 hypothetical protein [Actinopolymorpha cephalotaxi]SFH64494.1 hypothetical protein SAMN05421678_1266 [Actinopolymorpha cephalotaxi]
MYEHLDNDQVHHVGILQAAIGAVTNGYKVEVIPEDRRFRLDVNGRMMQALATTFRSTCQVVPVIRQLIRAT